MHIPPQSRPVERTVAAPCVLRDLLGGHATGQGVTSSGFGIQPSDLRDIVRIGSGAADPIQRIFGMES